ncbi:MAG: BON domain-containing protein [Pseudomonadota bacterium]
MRSRLSIYILMLAISSSLVTTGCAPILLAGVGTGAAIAEDRRTSGAFIEDEVIENKVQHKINQRYGYSVRVNAVSFNYNVLLAGQVPNEDVKRDVTALASEVPHVQRVYNETEIGPIMALSSRTSDSYITSKIKARFLDAQKFSVNHVKVYTEDGTVFLMGIVTREEADAATDIARTTNGVKKVVRLFEYGVRENIGNRNSNDYDRQR